jgi:hypothetical protein
LRESERERERERDSEREVGREGMCVYARARLRVVSLSRSLVRHIVRGYMA